MRTRISLIGFAVLLYMLLALLFVSSLHAQENNIEDYFSSPAFGDREFVDSDLLKIVLAGGPSRVDTGLLGGRLINDSTLVYDNDGEQITLIYRLQYIKDGEFTDEWSVGVDSALLYFNATGQIETIKYVDKFQVTSGDSYLLTGLKTTSNEIGFYPTIKPPSTMRIIGLKLKFWMLVDLFIGGATFDWETLRYTKTAQDIAAGSRGTMTLTSYDRHGNVVSERIIELEFLGDHQLKLTEDGQENIITYNSLWFFIP